MFAISLSFSSFFLLSAFEQMKCIGICVSIVLNKKLPHFRSNTENFNTEFYHGCTKCYKTVTVLIISSCHQLTLIPTAHRSVGILHFDSIYVYVYDMCIPYSISDLHSDMIPIQYHYWSTHIGNRVAQCSRLERCSPHIYVYSNHLNNCRSASVRFNVFFMVSYCRSKPSTYYTISVHRFFCHCHANVFLWSISMRMCIKKSNHIVCRIIEFISINENKKKHLRTQTEWHQMASQQQQ